MHVSLAGTREALSPPYLSKQMISKELTQIRRERTSDGSKVNYNTSRFNRRTETCHVTTFRFLGIPFYRSTELVSYTAR